MAKNPKYGLAGMLLGAALSVFSGGCAEMNDSDLAALGLLGYSSGARTPAGAQSGMALSKYAAESGRRQHEMNAARNVGVGNGQKIYTTDVYNLATGEKEVELANHWWIDYALDRIEDGRFTDKGYEMVQKINGKPVEKSVIHKRQEGNMIWLMRGKSDVKLAGRPIGAGHFPGME